MKKFFVVLLSMFMMVFISCGDKKDSEKEKNGNEVAEQDDTKENDFDTSDTELDDIDKTDSSDSTDSGDSGDSGESGSDTETVDDADKTDTASDSGEPADDSGDTQSDADTDTGSSEPDPDSEFTVNENIKTIPPEQNNEQYAECNDETFVEFCDGNTVVFCRGSQVVYSGCGDWTCVTTVGLYDGYEDRNYADCYKKCGKAGDKSTICKNSRYYSDDGTKVVTMGTLKHDLCLKTSKGNLLFEDTNRTVTEKCDSPCKDDTSCAGLAEIPAGQNNNTNANCDSETFSEFCEGNTSVFCFAGSVTRSNCGSKTCLTTFGINGTEKNSSACRQSCSDEGTASQTCSDVYLDNNSAYATTYDFCIPTSKGSLEFSFFGQKCESGCSSDGKNCR